MAYKGIQNPTTAFTLIPASQNLIAKATILNNITKSLTSSIEDIEDGLQKLNLGISVFVPVSTTEDDSPAEAFGYTKLNGRWGLVIREFAYDGGGDVSSYKDSFFSDSPREARIRAASQLQALFVEMTKQAELLTTKIKNSLDVADVFAEMLSNHVSANTRILPPPQPPATRQGVK